MRRFFRLLPLIVLICLLTPLKSAEAHGYLVRSIPQDRSVLSRSPARVQLWFSEGLEAKFSTLTVTDQAGQRVDLGDSALNPNNRAQLSVRLKPNLPDGTYIATIRIAFASDGHIQTDTLVFWVGQKQGDLASGSVVSSTQDVYPVEVLARMMVNIGLMLAFGTLFAYRFVLYPAWSNRSYPAGGLAPRVMESIYRLVTTGAILAFVGSVIWLFEQAAVLFSADLGRVFSDSLWLSVMNTTQFGDFWKVRAILIVCILVLIIPAESFGGRGMVLVYPLLSVGVVVAGAAMLTMSLVSHAPGATLWPLQSALVDWIHLLAAGTWVGGLLALVWTMRPALQPLNTKGKRMALLAVLKRFSPIAATAVGFMVASGVYASLIYMYSPEQSVTTSYGRTWIAKLVLVMPLLALGYLHNRALEPERFKTAEKWLERSLRIESAIGVSVLLAAALLTATPPPVPPNARAIAELPSYSAKMGDVTLMLTPNPGSVGTNSYDVKLSRGDTPIENARITAQFNYPELDKRSPPISLDEIGDGLYTTAGAEINRVGRWLALFNVILPGTDLSTRFALHWDAPLQSNIGATRQASALNWLAVIGLIVVLGVWIIPPLLRKIRTMPLEPQSVVVGFGVSFLTFIVISAAIAVMNNTTQAFENASNPKPPIVNTVLPDQASVDTGRNLTDTCSIDALTSTNPVLFLKLRSDAEIYQTFDSSMNPACRALDITQRWNYINYLRFQFGQLPSP